MVMPRGVARVAICRSAQRGSRAEARHYISRSHRFFLLATRHSPLVTWCFLAAAWADIDIIAERHLDGGENVFVVMAEALPVLHVTDVGAEFAVGPEEIADGREQVLDVVVLLDELSNV